jgi:hypothetical protein
LSGFARVDLEAGRTAEVEVVVAPASLAERDVGSHTMVVRPGRYELRVARHASDPGTIVEAVLD